MHKAKPPKKKDSIMKKNTTLANILQKSPFVS